MPTSPLVSVPDLATMLASDVAPVLLDVRWSLLGPPGAAEFQAGHLPGARFVDLDRELAGPPGRGGRHPLPETAVFQDAMRRCGLRPDSEVVVYDAGDASVGARLWWLLHYYGHDRVRVLDGGFAAWRAAGHTVETGDPGPVPAGTFVARPGSVPVLDADGAARVARDGVLLDARAAERYRGEVEPVDPVAGHIPGARSAPTSSNIGPDGRFLDGDRLRDRFEALGVAGGAEVGAYCGSGVTAAHEVLALRLAGFRAALYVGSWSEWVAADRPVATGGET